MKTSLKQNLGKKDIIQNIHSKFGTSFQNVQTITESIIEAITGALLKNKKINIKNFASFSIKEKKERKGRNPKTKEEFLISQRKTINFKVSSSLKKKLNNL